MKNKVEQPQIRFKGYTDSWEQRKLGEGNNEIGDGIHGTPIYNENGEIFFINGNNIIDGCIVVNQETKKVDKSQLRDTDKNFNDNTLFLSINGTIGKIAYYNGENIMLGKSIAYINCNQYNKFFIYNSLQLNTIYKYFVNNLTGTTIKNLSLKTIRETPLSLPTLPEQTKIGDFFSTLDRSITIHQRKLELLKEMKKGLLQKMFPTKSENIPQIRFKGFTDAWEQRKLGEYLVIPPKIVKDVKKSEDLLTVKLNLQGVYAGANRETLSFGSTKYYERKAGQFIYGKQNFFNGSMAIIPKELDGKATSGDVPSFNILGIDTNFLYISVSREIFWKPTKAVATGTGSKRIHEDTFLNFKINIPTEREQQNIGNIFYNLDHYITIHQRKLDTLKQMKKSLLQKMFI